jgi:hypothetical protein
MLDYCILSYFKGSNIFSFKNIFSFFSSLSLPSALPFIPSTVDHLVVMVTMVLEPKSLHHLVEHFRNFRASHATDWTIFKYCWKYFLHKILCFLNPIKYEFKQNEYLWELPVVAFLSIGVTSLVFIWAASLLK